MQCQRKSLDQADTELIAHHSFWWLPTVPDNQRGHEYVPQNTVLKLYLYFLI